MKSFPTMEEADTMEDEVSYSSEHSSVGIEAAPRERRPPPDTLEKAETRLVLCSKTMVVIVLLASAGTLGYFTWIIMSEEEEDAFKAQFTYDANEVLGTTSTSIMAASDVAKTFAGLFTSYSKTERAVWPNFTLPDLETFGQRSIASSGAVLIAFAPNVAQISRSGWEQYAVNHQQWIAQSDAVAGNPPREIEITPFIYKWKDGDKVPDDGPGPYSPLWQMSPPPNNPEMVNLNLMNDPTFQRLVEYTTVTRQAALSGILNVEEFLGGYYPVSIDDDPQSLLVQPVFNNWFEDTIVGHVVAVMPWTAFFENAVQESEEGIYSVLKESCGGTYTFRIDGSKASFVGVGDQHDSKYDFIMQSADITLNTPNNTDLSDQCHQVVEVYASNDMENRYTTNKPIIFTLSVVGIFFFASFVFFLYDLLVQWRQRKATDSAIRANAIVFSLFPAKVADQLHRDQVAEKKRAREVGGVGRRRRKMMNKGQFFPEEDNADDDDSDLFLDSKPIADLFPSATVLFADISGFTAWSSIREPSQVFMLLESIYRAFDKIATHRGIFKVETIGDCYVAVCGLPEPNKEHAVAMSRFARDCNAKMDELTLKLQAKLGPDTDDLAMRFGLHSGPVTAGVLRGDRARFQLFGDTVNTASRMESTGVRNKIHISQETADLLVDAGKGHWVVPREDTVVAKGKGELRTFWLIPRDDGRAASNTGSSEGLGEPGRHEHMTADMNEAMAASAPQSAKNQKIQRMIDWNSDILMQLLRLIVAKNYAAGGSAARFDDVELDELEQTLGRSGTALNELKEVIELPEFDEAAYEIDPETVEVSEDVAMQLHAFVTIIASLYQENPFHNFEHASHVSMSTVKLLSRIVAPGQQNINAQDNFAIEDLHDHTYGITSDPLTQFAVVLSALIHDVDHRGVPNFVLAKEDANLAMTYDNKSVAEQNSIDVAWDILMDDQFFDLRRAIYTTPEELSRFRDLVVNSVMATDIFDKELKSARNSRWQKAFGSQRMSRSADAINRKATIVIEHLIQASDVAHTMQHWHVFTKWNERLYREMYGAYLAGRTDNDPTEGWYKGELGFFDGYVIPLAKKLADCGVFGVSSDEYLNYAQKNREEWEARGQEIVELFHSKVARKNPEWAEKLYVQEAEESKEEPSLSSVEASEDVDDGDVTETSVDTGEVEAPPVEGVVDESAGGTVDQVLMEKSGTPRSGRRMHSMDSTDKEELIDHLLQESVSRSVRRLAPPPPSAARMQDTKRGAGHPSKGAPSLEKEEEGGSYMNFL